MYIHSFEKEDAIKKADEKVASDGIEMKKYRIKGYLSKADLLTMTAHREKNNQICLLSILQSVDPHQKIKFERSYTTFGKQRLIRILEQY